MDYGKQIKEMREAADIAQYKLAAKLQVPQSVLSDIERGRRDGDERLLARARAAIKAMVAERDLRITEIMEAE